MAPSRRSREEYERRLHKVLAYIDAHLDEPLGIPTLAREASFSPFHFHRIFSAHTGETLGNYLTRRRVETAAVRLASQPQLSVLEVSLAVGFSSPEAFSRAFKKHFGCTPSKWRDEPEATRKLSKISQVLRNSGQAVGAVISYDHRMATQTKPLQVAVTTRPPVRIAYLRYQGPFGPAVGRFWQEKVMPWLASNNLIHAPKYGISQDDPEITEQNKCRYDAGAEVSKDFVAPRGTQIAELPGGRYACAKFFGTSAEIPAAWNWLLREWLPSSGYQLDARPFFEYMPPDGECDEQTGAFSCELCIPVAKL
jgi:AraC family transcriptional regulator